jgi:hypothetical protein
MQNDGLPIFDDLRPDFLKAPLDLWVPSGLADHQVGWFMNLLKATLKSEMLGYLPLCAQRDCKSCSSCLWRVAGARTKSFFEKEKGVVTAAFVFGQIGERRVLYFPPLIEKLVEQQKHRRSKSKSVASGDLFPETCASFPQKGPRSSPSSSPFKKVSEIQKPVRSSSEEEDHQVNRSPRPYTLARRIIQVLGLTATGRNLEVIDLAVSAEAIYAGLSQAEAAERITSAALEDRRNGKSIDKFYFEDTKWRNQNGPGTGKPSATVERVNRNRSALIAAARAHAAERDGHNGGECEN